MANANDIASPAVPAIIVEIDPDGDIPPQLSDSVVAYKKLPWWDFYKGTAAALISAGIIEEHMLPGQPNRPKTSVRILGPIGKKRGLGHLYVIKSGARLYRVCKGICKQEEERRVEEENRRYAESRRQAASSQKSEEKPLSQAELAQQFKTKADAVAACKADGALQSFLKCVTGDLSLVANEKRGEA
jgi:hypothetical protein